MLYALFHPVKSGRMALRAAGAGLRAWRAALGSGSGVLPSLRSFSAQAEPVDGEPGFCERPVTARAPAGCGTPAA